MHRARRSELGGSSLSAMRGDGFVLRLGAVVRRTGSAGLRRVVAVDANPVDESAARRRQASTAIHQRPASPARFHR